MQVSQWLLDLARHASQTLLNVLVVAPLNSLYFRGPQLNGYGFWGGATAETICAAMLPGSQASFWAVHADECHALLYQRFDSFCVAVQTVVYMLFMFKLIHCFTFHWLVVRPTLVRLERLLARKNVSPTMWNDMPIMQVTTTGESKTHVATEPAMFSSSKHTAPSVR
jgi:hypothetical protein